MNPDSGSGDVAAARRGVDQEVNRLLALARDRSVAGREALAATVADMFHERGDVLTDAERGLMHDILRTLIADVERSVRKALATHLAGHANVPMDVARRLAEDDIEVAHPILVESPVLHDPDLIEIIRQRTLQHQLAIAMRSGLSDAVSDALVETDETEVIACLLENRDAAISRPTMHRLVEKSQEVRDLQPPLVRRQDLAPELARRMMYWVSAALRRHLVETHGLDEVVVDDAVGEAVDDVAHATPAGEDEWAGEDEGTPSISPAAAVRHLRDGEIAQFEAAMVRITRLRPTLVRRILYEPGGESLAVVCRVCGVPKPDFATIFLLTRKARPTRDVIKPHEIGGALAFYDRLNPDAAARVVARWRHDEAYQEALRAIEG